MKTGGSLWLGELGGGFERLGEGHIGGGGGGGFKGGGGAGGGGGGGRDLQGGEVTKDTMMVIPLLVSIVTTSQE